MNGNKVGEAFLDELEKLNQKTAEENKKRQEASK
jgi:hypothetical protein